MSPRPIRLVTFDLYDTLIELVPRRWERLAAILPRFGLATPVDALREADLAAEDFYTRENGLIPIRDRPQAEREAFRVEYMQRWMAAAGDPVDADTARALRAAYISEFDTDPEGRHYVLYADVLPALDRLRRAGVLRAIISNADKDITQFVTRLAVAHEMNLIVTSAVVGWEKPDVRTYRAAFEPLGVDPAEAIHIGDQPRSDVVGALAAGMQAALIDRYHRHDPAAHDVPVVRGLDDLVDQVLANNAAAGVDLTVDPRPDLDGVR
jgi:putative hydrolase of the HAD superfamily